MTKKKKVYTIGSQLVPKVAHSQTHEFGHNQAVSINSKGGEHEG